MKSTGNHSTHDGYLEDGAFRQEDNRAGEKKGRLSVGVSSNGKQKSKEQSGVCGKPRFVVGKKCREAGKQQWEGEGYEQRWDYEADTTWIYTRQCLKISMDI